MSDLQLVNPVKERMAAGEVAMGMNIRLSRTGDIARIANASGHDFIFIDTQHSLFSVESIGNMAQTAMGCGIAALVRVRSCDDPDVSLLLDNGALGIVYPDVNTADDARKGVRTAKFPPVGARSVCGVYPHFDYRPIPLKESVPVLNAATLVVCMIETVEGLENVEEIAAVDGVDVIHIGSSDLLVNMGMPGQFGAPEHVAAVERIIAAAVDNGKVAGLGGERDIDRQIGFIKKGVRFMTTQTDIAFLAAAATARTTELRDAIARA
ncbi:MAG: HpcH/HpaI aldolase family protein [Alphaproteobacteria bacterium]|jgi:2-keto-3-deoxy-L-rhamnonate aldolase RhmA